MHTHGWGVLAAPRALRVYPEWEDKTYLLGKTRDFIDKSIGMDKDGVRRCPKKKKEDNNQELRSMVDVSREDESQGEMKQETTEDLKEPLGVNLEVENRAKVANNDDEALTQWELLFSSLRISHNLLSQPNPTPTQQQLNLTRLRLDSIITPN